jgi:hypothetical protein
MKPTNHVPISHDFSVRFWSLGFLLAIFLISAASPHANATAVANSLITLQSLTITPASGSIMLSPTAQSFAQAQNSLGELVSNSDSGATANSTAAVTWANGSGSADSILRAASASANVSIPNITAAANSVGRGTLFDTAFSITGATGPVSVQFSATFPYAQFLMTDIYGVQATSEVVLNLSIDGSAVLFFDSPLVIGPSTTLVNSGSPTLTNSMTLTAGQTYDLYLEIDSESSGINAVPEPATLSLLLGGALIPLVRRRLQSLRS